MSNALLAAPGDVLLNSTGTGTIGRSCVFRETGRYVADGHVTLLRPRQEVLDGRWLNSLLRSDPGQRHLERYCYSGSTNQVELSRRALAATKVPVPPLKEQVAFGALLDNLDTTIRQTEAIIEKLQQLKQGLLHDLLTRGIDANGELRPLQEDAPDHYWRSEIGWLPLGWVVKSLGSFMASEITYGIVQAGPHVADGVPYIRTGDMAGDALVIDDLLRTSRRIAGAYKRSEIRAGDLVMAIRATVGKVLPVPAELDGANLTQGTARLSCNRETDADFMLWTLRHQRALRGIQNEIKGTTFAEITLKALREVQLAAPSDQAEQREIGARMSAIELGIQTELVSLTKWKKLKLGLMDDLLTGRVRVTPLLADTPT